MLGSSVPAGQFCCCRLRPRQLGHCWAVLLLSALLLLGSSCRCQFYHCWLCYCSSVAVSFITVGSVTAVLSLSALSLSALSLLGSFVAAGQHCHCHPETIRCLTLSVANRELVCSGAGRFLATCNFGVATLLDACCR